MTVAFNQNHPDLLGSPGPVRRKPAGRAQVLVTGVASLSLLAAGVVSVGYLKLTPHGASPESALPSSVFAFAKVDLDPSAEQKLAVYTISKRFPKTKVKGAPSIKDDLLEAAFRAADVDVDYAKDLKPWIGDRVGVGALPGTDAPHPILAVQYKDKGKALAGIKKLSTRTGDLHYAVSDVEDYLLLSDDQAVVDKAAHADKHLSDDDDYASSVDTLDGDQIITAWADMAKVFAAIPRADLEDNPLFSVSDLKIKGQYVLGLHAESDALELQGHTIGAQTGVKKLDELNKVGAGKGTNMVQAFPKDAVAAVSITGLGEALSTAYSSNRALITDLDQFGVLDAIKQAGISLPADITTLLGSEVGIYLAGDGDEPQGAVRVKTKDAAQARAVITKIIQAANDASDGDAVPADALDEVFRTAPGGYLVGYPQDALDAATHGALGSDPVFTKAVPDAKDAPLVIYVNIARLIDSYDLGDEAGQADTLQAFGMTTHADGADQAFRMRLTFR